MVGHPHAVRGALAHSDGDVAALGLQAPPGHREVAEHVVGDQFRCRASGFEEADDASDRPFPRQGAGVDGGGRWRTHCHAPCVNVPRLPLP